MFFVLFFSACTVNAATVNELFHQPNDPVVGNSKGPITIVEFFDYQCSHCAEMGPVLSSITKDNSTVRIVYKEFPIRGPVSDFASRAALAANLQGKYQAMHDELLKKSKADNLSDDSILKTARDLGLNMDKLKKDMGSTKISNQLSNTRELAINLKLRGTPAFYIGKTNANSLNNVKFYLGEMSKDDIQSQVDLLK